MAKYDAKRDRMLYLMEYKTAPKAVKTNIEYHANGADGKVYGILKEGTKYYIKTTEPGKENISEAYEYINGFINRRENEYKSYNEASKQLGLKLMSLNESYGKKLPTDTNGFNDYPERVNLTEEARKEIDRMNEIFENSCKIGSHCICDPESKGKATPEQTEKNNDPFSEKAEAKLDKDPKFNGTVKGATDENKDVSKSVDSKLQNADKMEKGGTELNNYKDAHDDLDGEGVADKKVKGGKVNESMFEEEPEDGIGEEPVDLGMEDEIGDVPADAVDGIEDLTPDNFDVVGTDGVEDDGMEGFEDQVNNPVMAGPDVMKNIEATAGEDRSIPDDGEEELYEEEDLESLIREFENEYASKITGPDAVLDKEKNPINGTKNGVGNEETMDRIDEDGNVNEPTKEGDEDTMKNYQYGYNDEKKLPAQSWDKLQESIKKITEDVYRKLTESKKPVKKVAKKKETLQEAIDRIVKEEVTKLDAWGKHPKFRKQPMTTPDNKEVLAGTAEKDWNDDSAKGEQPYGLKIGKGTPFDKVVDMLTDQVMAQLKESVRK